MTDPKPPLATVGILGAGQLAMMLSSAAADIGVATTVFAPAPGLDRPIGDEFVAGDLTDPEALLSFARSVDVITFETENIDIDAVDAVAEHVAVAPPVRAVRIAQDRLAEKDFIASLGIGTAPYARIDDDHPPAAAVALVGAPAIIKTRRLGYDGKGQVRVTSTDEAEAAWSSVGSVPCIVEGFVDFECEISVVAARSADGVFVPFEPGRNDHADGILRHTTVPADVAESVRSRAIEAAKVILDALDYVGVAGIEFFVVDGGVVVNEIAPRVHNSGHWTQLGCVVSQFGQHVRAITGRPLADGRHHAEVAMTNLIGDDAAPDALAPLLADPSAAVVLYGKSEIRPGRKMGHVNRLR
ncbi:MAG: 5-(carboxyamino)imidazole ribonucleotide synthase [Actinomycetota bacterium]